MFKKYLLVGVLFSSLVFSTNANARKLQSFADIVEDLTPSVVNISTNQKNADELLRDLLTEIPEGSPFYELFEDLIDKKKDNKKLPTSTQGSGFIISEDGYIVTNNHVIGEATEIEITFSNGNKAKANIIGRDKKSDIALIKVDVDKKLKPVKFANSDKIRTGDWVIAVGNPFGLGGSVTTGIISALGREISGSGIVEYIQTDTAINRGNSGGPMFDIKGQLVGITTAIFSTDGGNIGIGFAIPSNIAKTVIDQLKEHGSVTRGWLGVHVQNITEEISNAIDFKEKKGAYVVQVINGSPAEKSGIKIDDIIISFDGKKVEKTSQLPRIVGNTSLDKNTHITILRRIDGKLTSMKLAVKIEEPNLESLTDETDQSQALRSKLIGLQLIELEKIKDYFNYPANKKGLIILDIDEESSPQNSLLEVGDLVIKANQVQLLNIEDLEAIINEAKSRNKENIILSVLRKNQYFIVTIPLSQPQEN